jgi:hypothetical protein
MLTTQADVVARRWVEMQTKFGGEYDQLSKVHRQAVWSRAW